MQRAQSLVKGFRDISIAWDIAIRQFNEVKLPKLIRDLEIALPNLDRLPPDCYGALLSLVFNRGASFSRPGDRYREMREIRRLLQVGEWEPIPRHIRSMTRLWGAASGLARRRASEAELFERGLK